MNNEDIGKEFLTYAGSVYEELSKYFNEKYGWDSGILNEAIIKVHRYVIKKGEASRTSWKGLIFLSAKNLQTDLYRKNKKVLPDDYKNEVNTVSTEDKVRNDLIKDYAVMELLDIVENNFDATSARCFKIYHLVNKMTYKKLRLLTGVKDAKNRVVAVNKFLRENLTWGDIVRSFENKE